MVRADISRSRPGCELPWALPIEAYEQLRINNGDLLDLLRSKALKAFVDIVQFCVCQLGHDRRDSPPHNLAEEWMWRCLGSVTVEEQENSMWESWCYHALQCSSTWHIQQHIEGGEVHPQIEHGDNERDSECHLALLCSQVWLWEVPVSHPHSRCWRCGTSSVDPDLHCPSGHPACYLVRYLHLDRGVEHIMALCVLFACT